MRPRRSVNSAWILSVMLASWLAFSPAAGAESDPLPAVKQWESRMVSVGRTVCDLLGRPESTDQLLAQVYYDGTRVFFQMADYTNDASWVACAQRAEAVYRDRYVLPTQGAVPGHWNFTRGLAMDYLRSGDPASRRAVMLLAENAAFARDGTPPAWTMPAEDSREVAYAILSYLDAESVGAPRRARLAMLVEQALGHLDQWFGARTAPVITPFMAGLTAEALIKYYEQTRDPRIPPAIKLALNWLWAHAWISEKEAFWYDSRDTSAASPDLNLLIAPAYAWLYHQTGDSLYRDTGDRIFAGGVKYAWLGDGKHFNQNYRWSFDYVKWRRTTGSMQLHTRAAAVIGDGRDSD